MRLSQFYAKCSQHWETLQIYWMCKRSPKDCESYREIMRQVRLVDDERLLEKAREQLSGKLWEKAEAYAERLEEVAPDLPYEPAVMTQILLEKGKFEEAKAESEKIPERILRMPRVVQKKFEATLIFRYDALVATGDQIGAYMLIRGYPRLFQKQNWLLAHPYHPASLWKDDSAKSPDEPEI